MTKTTPDEIRLNGLRLLAKMVASAYLRRACQEPDSGLVTGPNEAGYGDKRLAGYSGVARTVQDKDWGKESVDAGTGHS